jgi:hypothetical protein
MVSIYKWVYSFTIVRKKLLEEMLSVRHEDALECILVELCSTKTCAQAYKYTRYDQILMICSFVSLGSVFFAVAARAAVVRHSNGLRNRVK